MNETTLTELVAFERSRIHYRSAPPEGETGFALLEGRCPVLISAPHGAAHWRGERWKQEEEYTSSIAHWLASQTGAYALYATHALRPDPHADRDTSVYKATLARVLSSGAIRLVLDLHGVKGNRDFALALGTINGESCPPYEAQLIACLEEGSFSTNLDRPSLDRLALNHPRYTGGVNRCTVTRFAWRRCGVASAQLEINAWLRVVRRLEDAGMYKEMPHFRGDRARILQLLKTLVALIESIS